ncbi:hypothetical protein [Pseudoalteromonas sp. T1lg23B]|uniref:hypothetical protein n=1 Tax=Pseudoalteromonas sp. T1lg23B TaxID=2077097 RepID=UPI000CF6732E|nr:hypothetical protein [Pseudoalteromonas sp. T1lg23B]
MFKLFKKQPKKQYTLSEFAFRRIYNDQVQVYHKGNNEWMAWYEIVGDVFDESGELVNETDLHHALTDRTKRTTYDNSHTALCNSGFESFVTVHVTENDSCSSSESDGASSSSSTDSASFD